MNNVLVSLLPHLLPYLVFSIRTRMWQYLLDLSLQPHLNMSFLSSLCTCATPYLRIFKPPRTPWCPPMYRILGRRVPLHQVPQAFTFTRVEPSTHGSGVNNDHCYCEAELL
jgi:hypothetical protein